MQIEKVSDPDFSVLIHELMASQGHYVPCLSHSILVGEEIRGAFSQVFLPCVFCWFNIGYKQPLLIYRFIRYMQTELGPSLGHHRLIWPVSENVLPHKYTERVGLTFGGNANWFVSGPALTKPTL